MKRKAQKFREKLSFTKAEMLQASVHMGGAGVSLPVPKSLSEELGRYESSRDWLSFGWLGNDNKFFSEATAASVKPQKEDFVQQPFRLLSATVVGGGSWKATDFSDVKVLKESRSKLEGKGVYKDHETDVNNWVGLVTGVKWSEGFTNSDGVAVPAGIDGIISIDAKTDPKLARGILMGAIYSNSVTVVFDWVMSHSFETAYEFYEKIGTVGPDGKMIRRVVTAIHDYHESSLVWLGADPFAKAYTGDSNLRNIDTTHIVSYAKTKFGEDKKKLAEESEDVRNAAEKNFTINFAADKSVLSLATQGRNTEAPETQKSQAMKKFLTAFMAAYGSTLGVSFSADSEVTPEMEQQLIDALPKLSLDAAKQADASFGATVRAAALAAYKKTNPEASDVPEDFLAKYTFAKADELAEAKVAKDSLDAVAADLKVTTDKVQEFVASLSARAAEGDKFLAAKREEALRLYKSTVGEGKENAAILRMFQTADSEAIDGLLTLHAKTATKKFGGRCKDCGSTEFSFQSSLNPEESEEDDSENTVTDDFAQVNTEELYRQLHRTSYDLLGRSTEKAEEN